MHLFLSSSTFLHHRHHLVFFLPISRRLLLHPSRRCLSVCRFKDGVYARIIGSISFPPSFPPLYFRSSGRVYCVVFGRAVACLVVRASAHSIHQFREEKEVEEPLLCSLSRAALAGRRRTDCRTDESACANPAESPASCYLEGI
jgi:hypothetical protein